MENEMSLEANAEGMNALSKAMGALVFALSRRLPPEGRRAFADDLAVMAQERNDAGDTTTEMLLIDLHRAAVASMAL